MKSKIVQDEVVYRGRVVVIHKIGLQMDDGKVIPRDLVEVAPAVVIVPVLDDGSVILIRNERYAVGEELLEFAAGKLDKPGEDPADAARRELLEETGYTARNLQRLGGFYTSPGACTEFMHAFLATGLTKGPQELEEYERIRVESVSPARLKQMILDEELHDSKSIAAFGLWQMRKGE